MAIKYGDLLCELRIKNKLTQKELGDYMHYSRQHISRIEANEVPVTHQASRQFSTILNFDFVKLSRHIYDFECYRDYEAYCVITRAIEKEDLPELENLVVNYDIDNTFNYGILVELKYYVYAFIYQRKDYKLCQNYCLDVLNINDYNLDSLVFTKLTSDMYSAVATILAITFAIDGDFLSASIIFSKLYNHCKNNLFNENTKHIEQDFLIKKIFLAAINNFAQVNFDLKNYDQALLLCNEAIEQSNEFNILYTLFKIYKLKMEIHYFLGEIDIAKKYYTFVEVFCETCNELNYFENTKKLVAEKYPKILE